MADLDCIKATFKNIAAISSFTSAQILTSPNARRTELIVDSQVRDLALNKQRNSVTHISFETGNDGGISSLSKWTTPTSKDVTLSVAHEYVDGQRIVFRTCEDEKSSEKRYFVERWSEMGLLDSLEVTSQHGDFYVDDVFGRIAMHPCKPSRIVYVAEKKLPKDDKTNDKYKFREEWGESFWGKADPKIFILDFDGGLAIEQLVKTAGLEDECAAIAGKIMSLVSPDDFSPGQPVFAPGSEDNLIWVAYKSTPRRYGPIYCTNRPTYLVESAYDGSSCRYLTDDMQSPRQPHFGDDGKLYYLTNPSGGAHLQCSELRSMNIQTKETTVIVPIVRDPKGSRSSFNGIYYPQKSPCYNNQIVLTTQLRSTTRAYAISMGDGTPHDLITNASEDDSWAIIGTGKSQVVLMKQNSQGHTELLLHRLRDRQSFKFLEIPAPITLSLTSQVIKYDKPTLEAVLYMPDSSKASLFSPSPNQRPPAMICPHGGPHAAHTTAYNSYAAQFVELGIAVLNVNFTGSLGFGQNSIEALTGHCGSLDVDEVQLARDKLAESGLVDETRIGVIGGSHGGFLTAWLIGKYPNSYRCAILHNPAIDIATFPATSDIPDWAFSEMGLPYNFSSPALVTPSNYKHLWEHSPMSVIDNIKSPSMVLLGGKDRRVPLKQGLNWVQHLKAKGVDIRCYIYPEDDHPLDRIETQKLSFEAQALFLKEHL